MFGNNKQTTYDIATLKFYADLYNAGELEAYIGRGGPIDFIIRLLILFGFIG